MKAELKPLFERVGKYLTRLDLLAERLGLTPFERGLVLLAAAPELDGELASALANTPEARRGWATFAIATQLLEGPHWDALAASRPLRRFAILDFDPRSHEDSVVYTPLRVDERVLQYLVGVDCHDARLARIVHPVSDVPPPSVSQRAAAQRLVELWTHGTAQVIQLAGEDYVAKLTVAHTACARLARELLSIRAASLAGNDALLTLIERELLLRDGLLLIDLQEHESEEQVRAAVAAIEQLRSPVVLACRDLPRTLRRAVARMDIGRATFEEQASLWRAALGSHPAAKNGQVDQIVAQFRLDSSAIAAVGRTLSDDDSSTLWEACRMQARPRLDDLAQRIEPAADWQQIVLPDAELATLREIAMHARLRAQVYEGWGFGSQVQSGLGVTALFCGSSGTGKTMAAGVLANDLGLDLYRVDLSQVISKWIGETEKNLRRIFDAAEGGGSVLLFDEADALFGKRTEVKDSHDRFANIEVSYLLQRMETYRGLAILTTNFKDAIDGAFMRRIRFVVEFPFPDAAQRAEIWRRVFPGQAPREGLDAQALARLHVAGGNIRNIALCAAFLAANEGAPVRMAHVLRAAQREYAKLERPLTELEWGGGGRA
jgi:ATP-dependent 26S proteasome regulatory subunit